MVEDRSDSQRENPLPPLMGYSFRLALRNPANRVAHTKAFVTPVVEHWLKREIAQRVHYEGSIRRPHHPLENSLARSYISLVMKELQGDKVE